jgi:hypothetical protein
VAGRRTSSAKIGCIMLRILEIWNYERCPAGNESRGQNYSHQAEKVHRHSLSLTARNFKATTLTNMEKS